MKSFSSISIGITLLFWGFFPEIISRIIAGVEAKNEDDPPAEEVCEVVQPPPEVAISKHGDDTMLKYGIAQVLPSLDEVFRRTHDYMTQEVMVYDRYETVRDLCRNEHEYCSLWAALGECDTDWMKENCGPACRTCEYLHDEAFCRRDPLHGQWQNPGDLSKMFQRVITLEEFREKYSPTVISQPNPSDPKINDGPWIVTLENFLSSEEAELLIQHGKDLSYEKSYTVGDEDEDLEESNPTGDEVDAPVRKSRNTWCNDACYHDPRVKEIWSRLEYLTQIDKNCSEPLQLLKYEPGEYYKEHLDWIDDEEVTRQGPRLLTVFMYLNDVEEGGETVFTEYNLTVSPKRGRVVMWPSVLDEDPFASDERTWHEARPVLKGLKYGANAWFHSHPVNYNDPQGRCRDDDDEEEYEEEADDVYEDEAEEYEEYYEEME